MAETQPEERTELPTDKRWGQLRKEGQLHLSAESVKTMSLISGFLMLSFMWSWFYQDMLSVFRESFLLIGERREFSNSSMQEIATDLVAKIGPTLFLFTMSIAAVASLTVFLQTQWNMREKWIKWRFQFLNPITGIKRIFSINNAVNTLRDILKLLLILPVAYFALQKYSSHMIQLIHMSVTQIMNFMANAAYEIFWKIAAILIALSIFDYVWSRFQWFKQNKMTKKEVKDERRSLEGDEATKRRIQSKGLQRIMQRIMQSVPQADVVITNPTHYAVALQYDRERMNAPRVVAKGKGHIALRIREIAKESGVPILERKPLARALYASCEVGSEIPRELFKAVARVLAYVYKIKPKKKKRVIG